MKCNRITKILHISKRSSTEAEPQEVVLCNIKDTSFVVGYLTLLQQVSSSSSSWRAASADFSDTLPLLVSIVHRSWQVFYSCSSMWGCPHEYIAYVFVLASPVMSRISCLSNLDGFRGGSYVSVQLLLCGMLPLKLVQHISHLYSAIAVKLFLHTLSQRPWKFTKLLLRCGTRPYERGTQWDSNSLV